MPHLAAVLDANVLFPASLRDTLLRAVEENLYEALWSDQILDEAIRNLVATNRITPQGAAHLNAQLKAAFPSAFVDGYDALIPTLGCDEKDRHVLAAAIHGEAHAIVTFNLRYFPIRSLAPYGIEAQHPDVFLTRLYAADADAMTRIVKDQAAGMSKSSVTPMQVLDTLAQHAPRFVALARPNVVR